MRKIFLIIGKAGAGKDTLVKYLTEELEVPMALSFTTRPKRLGETQGKEYDFISLDRFKRLDKENKLAETTSYKVVNGETWYYGLTKEELEKSKYVIAIVNPAGQRQIKELYKDKVVSVHIYANAKERIDRYLGREENISEEKVEECCRRFLADKEDFYNINTDYLIINNDLEKAKKELKEAIRLEIGNDILRETEELFKHDPMRFINENI